MISENIIIRSAGNLIKINRGFRAMAQIISFSSIRSVCVSVVMMVSAQALPAQHQQTPALLTGADQLDQLLPVIQGKRVALFVNYTAMVGKTHLADTLVNLHIDLKKIFSPEHGFRGNAPDGETVNNDKDSKTGLPIVSLYGDNKKARPEQLTDVDVVIFDIQDVGTRFFTYISSLHYMMEACAENGKRLIILDRPNPNAFIDGPLLQPAFKSFVGMHPVPIAHGMTVGELARMVNGEGWLENGEKCDLQVIALRNYTHDTPYLLPLKPSPNLPNNHAVALYPYICLFEGTALSLGRGTLMPFEVLGHPDLKDQPFEFTPENIPGMSVNPPLKNILCHGIDLRNEKPERRIALQHLISMYAIFPAKDKFFKKYFDTLAGSTELRTQIEAGWPEEKIRASWEPGLNEFRKKRTKYLLYD